MAFRQTVDLTQYPGLVMIVLGMKALNWRGVSTVLSFGRRIGDAVQARPDGLLLHEGLFFSLWPLHVGMRQYWRDLESLERWTRESPHLDWWRAFHKDPRGTAFWHEAYFAEGGIDSVFVGMDRPFGLMKFAPAVGAHGSMASARMRARKAAGAPPQNGEELYPDR